MVKFKKNICSIAMILTSMVKNKVWKVGCLFSITLHLRQVTTGIKGYLSVDFALALAKIYGWKEKKNKKVAKVKSKKQKRTKMNFSGPLALL